MKVTPYIAFLLLLSAQRAYGDPLACQPNAEQPMLPIFHIIGNVTKTLDGDIELERINDCSGITYYGGLYHVWHQCCQSHFDHVISKDLIHWQRLPPPIQPWSGAGGYATWDGSVTILPKEDGGPIILYDAQDGKLVGDPLDKPILGVARLVDIDDRYLLNFSRRNNPVIIEGDPAAFPGQIWKNGDHWNMVMQGNRYQSNDNTFHNWKNMGDFVGYKEGGGQWWMPVPNQIDGSPPPAGVANRIVSTAVGNLYVFGNYDRANETFEPWSPTNDGQRGLLARLEGGRAAWFGGQMTHDPEGKVKDRMFMIGWALDDYRGPAGPGIKYLTRLSLLREVNFDAKTMNLVANPLPELKGLRIGSIAREKAIVLSPTPHVVKGSTGGAASSADIELTFMGKGILEGSFGACVLANSTNSGLAISIKTSNKMASVEVGNCSDAMSGIASDRAGLTGPIVPLFDEETITVRITPDRSLADFFVQGGRWSGSLSWLSKTPRLAGDSDVLLWSNTPNVMADIDVYGMGCGWLDPSYTEHPTLLSEEVEAIV